MKKHASLVGSSNRTIHSMELGQGLSELSTMESRWISISRR